MRMERTVMLNRAAVCKQLGIRQYMGTTYTRVPAVDAQCVRNEMLLNEYLAALIANEPACERLIDDEPYTDSPVYNLNYIG